MTHTVPKILSREPNMGVTPFGLLHESGWTSDGHNYFIRKVNEESWELVWLANSLLKVL